MTLLCAALVLATAPKWKLVWHDEFNKAGRPDPKKWTYEVGYVRNGELQFYTKDRPENARVEGGNLVIEARNDSFEGHKVTSASLTTQGLASWTYGRIEVKAKVPTGKGTWPAIWTLGTDITDVGWPACGEIDIMENVGFDRDRAHFNIHTPHLGHAPGSSSTFNTVVPNLPDGWHIYAMEWFPDRVDLLMDGKKMLSYLNDGKGDEGSWPFHKPQYLILNLAIGGAWGGQQGVDDAIFPSKYLIKYVRVYQQAGKASEK
jgi:beta-glucanase (GH16 family)